MSILHDAALILLFLLYYLVLPQWCVVYEVSVLIPVLVSCHVGTRARLEHHVGAPDTPPKLTDRGSLASREYWLHFATRGRPV